MMRVVVGEIADFPKRSCWRRQRLASELLLHPEFLSPMKRLPSRCASPNQIVRPHESAAETQPHAAFLRTVCDDFRVLYPPGCGLLTVQNGFKCGLAQFKLCADFL